MSGADVPKVWQHLTAAIANDHAGGRPPDLTRCTRHVEKILHLHQLQPEQVPTLLAWAAAQHIGARTGRHQWPIELHDIDRAIEALHTIRTRFQRQQQEAAAGIAQEVPLW